MLTIAASAVSIIDFHALLPSAGVSLVQRFKREADHPAGREQALPLKRRRFGIDEMHRAVHTAIARRIHYTACSPHVAGRFDPIQHRPRMTQPASVTELIRAADSNVPQAVNKLFDVLYNDLRRVANARLHANGRADDMSPTLLVHETYERLVRLQELNVSDRKQFFTYASTVMRSVIVDMARARLTDRRGGGVRDIPIDTLLEASIASPLDDSVVQINDALEQLAAAEPRLAQVVEMRYFGGLSMLEIAEALDITERTVARDWSKARSLLAVMLSS